MKFGRSTKEKHEAEQAEVLRMIKGVRKFAFFPTYLEDKGKYTWLSFYWAYFKGFRDWRGEYALWSFSRDEDFPTASNYAERHGKAVLVEDFFNETIRHENETRFVQLATEPYEKT